MAWQQVLADAGLVVAVVDADHVTLLEADDRSLEQGTTMRLVESSRPVHPSRIKRPQGGERALLAVPVATNATISAARAAGWDLVADDGALDLQLNGKHLVRRAQAIPSVQGGHRRGPVGRSMFTVARALLAQTEPVGQGRLVDITGVSQPTVSRVCAQLRERGLIRGGRSIEIDDWNTMARWWLDSYPGAGGPSTLWFGLDPVMEQVATASGALPGAVISGSAAADLLSPWQRPDFAVVYTASATLLTEAGFVPVSDPAAATLKVVAPADRSMWSHRPLRRVVGSIEVSVADPLQVAFDVLDGPDSVTREEAVEHLLDDMNGSLRAEWSDAWSRRSDD